MTSQKQWFISNDNELPCSSFLGLQMLHMLLHRVLGSIQNFPFGVEVEWVMVTNKMMVSWLWSRWRDFDCTDRENIGSLVLEFDESSRSHGCRWRGDWSRVSQIQGWWRRRRMSSRRLKIVVSKRKYLAPQLVVFDDSSRRHRGQRLGRQFPWSRWSRRWSRRSK